MQIYSEFYIFGFENILFSKIDQIRDDTTDTPNLDIYKDSIKKKSCKNLELCRKLANVFFSLVRNNFSS